jgi:hypothetical protein
LPSISQLARRRISTSLHGSILILLLAGPAMLSTAQGPAAVSNAPASVAVPVPRTTAPSVILQPALDVLKQAVTETNVDRWKASNAIRDEAQTNLRSIERDVEATLPPLLAATDAAPDSAAKALPAYRNIEALYDVLLRLNAAGQLAAPRDQASALEQALADLNDGRRALGDQLQRDADAQDRQVVRLQAALKAVPPPAPPPVAAVCPPVPPKKSVRPAVKRPSAGSTPANSTGPTTASH